MRHPGVLRLVQGLLFVGGFVLSVLFAGTDDGSPLEDLSAAWTLAFPGGAFLLLGVLAAVSIRAQRLKATVCPE